MGLDSGMRFNALHSRIDGKLALCCQVLYSCVTTLSYVVSNHKHTKVKINHALILVVLVQKYKIGLQMGKNCFHHLDQNDSNLNNLLEKNTCHNIDSVFIEGLLPS